MSYHIESNSIKWYNDKENIYKKPYRMRGKYGIFIR